MTTIRFRLIPLLAALAALPAVSNAKPADVALKACAREIASDFGAKQGLTPKYSVKLDESLVPFSAPSADVYRFTLIARNPKNGAVVARAQCDAQFNGRVLSFRTLPLKEEAATLAKSE